MYTLAMFGIRLNQAQVNCGCSSGFAFASLPAFDGVQA
jgi:hypothetical protein